MKQNPVVLQRPAQKRKLSIVSEIIARGSNSYLGILRDDPSCVLKWPFAENQYSLNSFEWEKRALQLLGYHRYIVKLFESSARGLRLEYHPYQSMRHYYQQYGLPSIEQRYRWCHQAVAGFAYIHSKNLVHQDVSARNLLISSDMDIKICDFGSSSLFGEAPHGFAEFRYSGAQVPQDWKSTFKYDLFCMGALFYEILLGSPPYEQLCEAEVEKRYREWDFPSLDGIELGYAMIIQKCWRDQYSSIQELERDLPPLLSDISEG